MKLVKQTSPTTCGQACVAILLDITLEEAIELVGHDGIFTWGDLFDVLHVTEAEDGPSPSGIIAIQYHSEPNGDRGHWTIIQNGKVFDPACKKKLWPVTYHFPIDFE